MNYQKEASITSSQATEANNRFNDHKDSVYFSLSNPEFAEIYEEQYGWVDPMPLLRNLFETLERDLHFYMIRPDARPDIVKKNRDRLQMIVQSYYSLLGIDLATWKLINDGIRYGMKKEPESSSAMILLPLKLEDNGKLFFIDLWHAKRF